MHRKCIISRLRAKFVFGHLCSAPASVGCCGLNPDTRCRPGFVFFERAYRRGSRKRRAVEKCFDRKWEWTADGLMWRISRGTFRRGGEEERQEGQIRSFEPSEKASHSQGSWDEPPLFVRPLIGFTFR